ncbi:sulfonate transport system substrate-binding protein [Amycolatopsis bartoniae]|uniref:Putative aliphatic sulfonates-binding protein n=1 Tax=Amycolatopsis bartoniae TaxID=941986 RepID=A0A8H9M520_9PSEU|nr:ABC transporter substrate-binding protein [Amycolatopsis bartoniae]MBB2937172.1 sulfonate transport system substrate-binding protein [Amycolatopsis bartoniae]TVT06042.1 ABC transporter substrate-binding protein [Amycolatopsis bartoniae]GHF52978.1 ABC transporter substrate-binding protein [Amycolatopsis bartoniae]
MRSRNLFAALLLTLGLAACGGTTAAQGPATVPPPVSAADLAKVTLKVGDQKGNSQTLLKAAGLLDDLPYKIEWATFTSGPPLLEAASAGAIDIGGVGNTPPIFSAAADGQISVVSAAKGNVVSDTVLVPADSPLKTVADLRGKTIGVAKGSSAHGQILLTLRRAGMSTKDVKLSFLQPADAYGAFTQHRIDAWAVWDPYTSQAQLEAHARVLADGTGTANGYSFQVAGRAALSDAGKNAAIRDYVVRIAKAERWSDAHRDQWAQAWAADTGLAPDVARAATSKGPDLPVELDDTVVASEQELSDAFTNDKVLPGKVDFAKFVDRRYAADLAAARG